MNERKKVFRPSVIALTGVYLLILILDFYSSMYNGEGIIRREIQSAHRYAIQQEDPMEWVAQYRENLFSEIEDMQDAYMNTESETEQEALFQQVAEKMETGGQFGTRGIEILTFNQLYARYSHIAQLKATWEKQNMKALRAAKRAGVENVEMTDDYGAIEVPAYGIYQPYEDLVSWNRDHGWLYLVLFCAVCAFIFTMEYKSGMHALIRVQAVHPVRVGILKAWALFLYLALGVTILFAVEVGIAVYMTGNPGELMEPFQALYCMEFSRMKGCIIELILAQYGAMMCTGILVIGLTATLSVFMDSPVNVLLVAVAMCGATQFWSALVPEKAVVSVGSFIGSVAFMQQTPVKFCIIGIGLLVVGAVLTVFGCVRFAGRCSDGRIRMEKTAA